MKDIISNIFEKDRPEFLIGQVTIGKCPDSSQPWFLHHTLSTTVCSSEN